MPILGLFLFRFFTYLSYKLYNIQCQPPSAYTAIDFSFLVHNISSMHSEEYCSNPGTASFLPTFQAPFVAGCALGTRYLQTPCKERSHRLQDFQRLPIRFILFFLWHDFDRDLRMNSI
jgi:hypothetical protein